MASPRRAVRARRQFRQGAAQRMIAPVSAALGRLRPPPRQRRSSGCLKCRQGQSSTKPSERPAIVLRWPTHEGLVECICSVRTIRTHREERTQHLCGRFCVTQGSTVTDRERSMQLAAHARGEDSRLHLQHPAIAHLVAEHRLRDHIGLRRLVRLDEALAGASVSWNGSRHVGKSFHRARCSSAESFRRVIGNCRQGTAAIGPRTALRAASRLSRCMSRFAAARRQGQCTQLTEAFVARDCAALQDEKRVCPRRCKQV